MPVERSRTRMRKRRSMWRRYRGVVVALLSVLAVAWLYGELLGRGPAAPGGVAKVAGAASAPVAERTAALRPVALPQDDGPHADPMEWWYYNGHLRGDKGEQYSFHVAIFLYDGMVRHTVFHGSLTDHRTGQRYTSQVRTAGIPSGKISDGFDFNYQGWRAAGAGPAHTLNLQLKDFALVLDMQDAAPPMLHRAAGSQTPGILDFGPQGGISYYYSRPRMQAKGTLRVGGVPQAVQGAVWFDHQWGAFDGGGMAWNWFALQLDDGADVMLYQLYDKQGQLVMTTGTLTSAQGLTTALADKDIQLRPEGRWTSPKTGTRYPAGWTVQLPQGALEVKPLHIDSEFSALETTFNIYWEGAVAVTGAATGKGFLEMSGYDRHKTLVP